MAKVKAFKMIPHCTKDTITYEMEELVRCEDCEYSYTEGFVHPHLICEKHPEFEEVADDWFCADGWKA